MDYWRYECSFCDWFLVIPVPMLEFEVVQQIGHSLIESHNDVHAAKVHEDCDQFAQRGLD